MKEIIANIITSEYFVYIFIALMSLVLFGITELIKIPYKKLTGLAKSDKVRRILNIFIIFVPLGLGFLAEYFITEFASHADYNILVGFGNGALSIIEYALVDQLKAKNGKKIVKYAGLLVGALKKTKTSKGEIAQNVADVIQSDILDGQSSPQNQNETIDAVKKFFDEVK